MNEQTIFAKASELQSPEARAAFLDEHCAHDADMRRNIEALLKAHDRPGGVIDALVAKDEPTVAMDVENDDARVEPAADTVDLSFLGPGTCPGSLGSLGLYDVVQVIGRGGMGVVLKAQDNSLGKRIVAIKVLSPQIAADRSAKTRFEREAQSMAAVSHDHIVAIHAVGEFNGLPYLVMECIVGRSLQQKIKETGPLELKEILRIGMQTAQGLAVAHKQGLIHRDVTPANILLQNGIQRVKITDFGLARAADDVGITGTGQIVGTPLYMSPEQAQGLKVDHRSDLFSLGSVLYTMCTGRPAFRGTNIVAVLQRVVHDKPRPIREVNPEIPEWLVDIVDRLLAKSPSERFQTAQEVAVLFEQWLAHCQQPMSVPRPVPLPVADRGTAVTTTFESVSPSAPVEQHGNAGATPASDPAREAPKRHSKRFAAFATLCAIALIVAISGTLGTWNPWRPTPPVGTTLVKGNSPSLLQPQELPELEPVTENHSSTPPERTLDPPVEEEPAVSRSIEMLKEKTLVQVTHNTLAYIHDSSQSESTFIDKGTRGTIDKVSESNRLYRVRVDSLEEPWWIPFDFVKPVELK